MALSSSEKIKIMLKRRGMTLKELSEKLGQKGSNLSNKMSRDNFPEKEIREIADTLGCDYEAYFVMRDTGDKI